MALDLTGYFERVGYHGATEPTLDVLRDLVTAHIQAIPFENLDPLLGRAVDNLTPEVLADTPIHRRRGGWKPAPPRRQRTSRIAFEPVVPCCCCRLSSGSHYEGFEQPDLVVQDLRTFFATVR